MTVGHHVDVSNLTEEECNKIISVISKDIMLRKTEKERSTFLNKKFEDLRREILIGNQRRTKRYSFDDHCLICGKHLFTFCCFFHRGVECVSCEHYCCDNCRNVLLAPDQNPAQRFYLCDLCLQKRNLKFKTSEWFYELFQKRFKRFGSAKVLRAIYKQRKSIEPRVITLLALCRVITPARMHSVPSLVQPPKTQDDGSVGYVPSPYMRQKDKDILNIKSARKRSVSESDAEMEFFLEKDIPRCSSDTEIGYNKATTAMASATLDNTKVPSADLSVEKQQMENVDSSKAGNGDNDDFRISQSEDTLDEWIAEGYETIPDNSGSHASSEGTISTEASVDCSAVMPVVKFSIKAEESLDKEDYDEVTPMKR